jgi:hypothetical protein
MNLLARSTRRNSKTTVRSTGSSDAEKEFNLFEDIPKQHVEFRVGLPIMVEVVSFGPLGASVVVIGKGSHDAATVKLADSANPLAVGLIYQSEIQMFRESRRNVDVVLGEILPAYVERVRDDGKIDVSLRVIGGRAKVDKWSGELLKRLEELGELPIGDRSTAAEVAHQFPGMSKTDFKKCIGSLFERKLVFPFADAVLPYKAGLAIATVQRAKEGTPDDDTQSTSTSSSTDSSGRGYSRPYDNNTNYGNNNYRSARPTDDGYRSNNSDRNRNGSSGRGYSRPYDNNTNYSNNNYRSARPTEDGYRSKNSDRNGYWNNNGRGN